MKILADTSVWIDHLRHGYSQMSSLLATGDIVLHDHVVGELCLGGLSRDRLAMMQLLHRCSVASHDEVMHLIGERRLAGRGLGYVDTHLLAAALIGRLRLWTLDKALQQAAQDCGCGMAMH
ncbi:MAG: type II toxin-antitoxin system VapC family toxin [Rhodocyclales bacterium]|nr:type II toxin-antitoxin system VapC family toxin [Rhodocyclales bacterium]